MFKCFRDIPFGIVMARTDVNGFWQKHVPPRFVFRDLQNHILRALIDRQRGLIAKWKKEHPKECEENPDAYKNAPELRAFIILDDVVSLFVRVRMEGEFFVCRFHVSCFRFPTGWLCSGARS